MITIQIKTSFLFYMFTLFLCLNLFFLGNSAAQVSSNYTFETIDVPGVEFLALTASSDFEDYAGYTKSADGQKEVAFTLIDGVFTTYDFPDSQKTHFYALGNDGRAAGYYEDSDGLHHGVVLENGELHQYDVPNAVQTEIYGISDATGALTGNFIDDSGVRRGFTGDTIIEFPGASETYADFMIGGRVAGSYVDADGMYHGYLYTPDGKYISVDVLGRSDLEYFFIHGINAAGVYVARSKRAGKVPRTHVGTFRSRQELQFPGSVSTEGWNVNQDGSIVGHYASTDGRVHGFVARPVEATAGHAEISDYTFETIDVPGVAVLRLSASSDFEDYAGSTLSPDGQKMVAFTLIDGVFETYDFPGSKNTYFYALGNNGDAAGYYEDSDGLHHGVILQDKQLRQYDFEGAVETELWGISDATGALTGNFIAADGIRRGFTGDTIIEFPGAIETYADFVAAGRLVGSYVDADGIYHAYAHTDGLFTAINFSDPASLEYYFIHGVNDAGTYITRTKRVGDVPRTHVSSSIKQKELHFPGSVSTEGYNINQDGSIVGHYASSDGRIHGFIARPVIEDVSEPPDIGDDPSDSIFNVTLAKGLNMISVPLAPSEPMTARTLAKMTDATTVITLDTAKQQFIGWTPTAPDDGFTIEGSKGYIVNVSEAREVAFVGSAWTNQMGTAAAPAITPLIRGDRGVAQETWAFVVSGHLAGRPAFDGYQVIVRNLRTDRVITASVRGDYFAAATADLSRRRVVQVGDVIEVYVIGPDRNVESHPLNFKVTPENITDAVLSIRLDDVGQPKWTQLLQNFPNPFNPETWIPYQLETSADVTLQIYDATGGIVRTIDLGFKPQGFYMTRARAAYWDGRNSLGEQVASGIYFYSLHTPDFSATRKMLILK